MTSYGKSLLMDIHRCDVTLFTREYITEYYRVLCEMLGAKQEDLHFWDDVGVPEEEKQTDPKLVGTSAVQFILTSGITLHALDELGRLYVDVFSCAEFDEKAVIEFTASSFEGIVVHSRILERD